MPHRKLLPCQVLVVGGGPVGLLAALSAAKRGFTVRVIDEYWRNYERGHAALLHAESLRLLETHGLTEELARHGRSLDRIALRIDGERVASLALPAPVLALPQTALESALLRALRKHDVEVLMAHKAVGFERHPRGVTVTVARRELVTRGSPASDGEWDDVERLALEVEFVVGADGHNSTVRQAIGSKLVDQHHTETFAMFEFPTVGRQLDELNLSISEEQSSVLFPLPDGRTRGSFQVLSALDIPPDRARLKSLLSAQAPWFQETPDVVDWASMMHFERRAVEPFGHERLWLIGDAAHVTGPLGAQSMNVGLWEAHRLIEWFTAVKSVRGPSATLEREFEHERQREWRSLLSVYDPQRLTKGGPRWLSANAERLVAALPASGSDLVALLDLLAEVR